MSSVAYLNLSINSVEGEDWANVTIPEYRDYYMVSNIGRVKSVGRRIDRENRWHMTVRERILKAQLNKKGYLRVRLCHKMKERDFSVHQLVALAFVVNPDPLLKNQVNHLDTIKTNNFYLNLRWDTNDENQKHAAINGLRKGKIFNNKSKFSKEEVTEIRMKYNTGESVRSLSVYYNVAYTTIRKIVKNITYDEEKMYS